MLHYSSFRRCIKAIQYLGISQAQYGILGLRHKIRSGKIVFRAIHAHKMSFTGLRQSLSLIHFHSHSGSSCPHTPAPIFPLIPTDLRSLFPTALIHLRACLPPASTQGLCRPHPTLYVFKCTFLLSSLAAFGSCVHTRVSDSATSQLSFHATFGTTHA